MTRRPWTAMLPLISLILICALPAAYAQMDALKNSTPAERARLQTDMMKSKLSLTPDQTTKIAAINEKYAKQMEPIIKGQEGPLARMRQMREVSAAKETELKSVLSPEQFQKYLAEKAEMREKF